MKHVLLLFSLFLAFGPLRLNAEAPAWWDRAWAMRQAVDISAPADGTAPLPEVGDVIVLVRLHGGNFDFSAALEDGSDLRVVADDQSNVLPFFLERYDSLLNEGFLWVRLPAGEQQGRRLWIYGGNPAAPAAGGSDGAVVFGETAQAILPFGERNANPRDISARNRQASNRAVVVAGSLIGGGVRLDGVEGLRIPAGADSGWAAGSPVTVSVWLRPVTAEGEEIVFHWGEAGADLRVGLLDGSPFIESAGSRTAAAAALDVNRWSHLAVVAAEGRLRLFVNGDQVATGAGSVPAWTGDFLLGGPLEPVEGISGLNAEIDQFEAHARAWGNAELRFTALSQGTSPEAARLVAANAPEYGQAAAGGHHEMLEHMFLFGDIARNMMFDGWIAVGVCVIMIFLGWTVAAKKYVSLGKAQKSRDAFLEQWERVSGDLTVLDHEEDDAAHKAMAAEHIDDRARKLIEQSQLYRLYHIGVREIRHRMTRGGRGAGLSGRSVQAIRASLEAGLVRENQKMGDGLIFLTTSIAGGPYVGLLGTVVGVMITFALIAKTGEVEVNTIAPGIASALLATTMGLVVAIPALFIYSYLSIKIKDLAASMQVFIDEFVAKVAEYYPEPSNFGQERGGLNPRSAASVDEGSRPVAEPGNSHPTLTHPDHAS